MHDYKQSTVTVKVFLYNQHHFNIDVIRIKMIPRDLPYNKSIRTKARCENKFQIISMQNAYVLCSNTLPQRVLETTALNMQPHFSLSSQNLSPLP